MERNIFDTLSEVLEEIDGKNYTVVDYLSDEEEDGNNWNYPGC